MAEFCPNVGPALLGFSLVLTCLDLLHPPG